MKRKQIRLAAVLSCAALLLTGCHTDSYVDYSVSHKEYLDYSLGEGYQFSEPEYEMYAGGSKACYRVVTYQNQTLGKERRFCIESYVRGGWNPFGDQFTAERYHDYWLLRSCYAEANAVAMQEFADTILSKYFPEKYNLQAFAEKLEMRPKANVCFSEETLYALSEQHVKAVSMMEAAVEPGTGFQVSTATLKSIAQDHTMIPTFDFIISEDCEVQPVSIDPAPYIEIMEQIYQDYLRVADAPQNYHFTVRRAYSDGNGRHFEELVYEKASLIGVGEFKTPERYGQTCETSKRYGDEKMCEELDEILAQQSNGNT